MTLSSIVFLIFIWKNIITKKHKIIRKNAKYERRNIYIVVIITITIAITITITITILFCFSILSMLETFMDCGIT